MAPRRRGGLRRLQALQRCKAVVSTTGAPGTPRSGGTLAAVGTTIYLLGGVASGNSSHAVAPSKKPCTSIRQPGCGASVSDNWKLDTTSMKWTQVNTTAYTRPASLG